MHDERADRADDCVRFVQSLKIEVAAGALILVLASGGGYWKFALTIPFIITLYEALFGFLAKANGCTRVERGARH